LRPQQPARQRAPTHHFFIVEEVAMKIMMIAALVSIAATTGTAFAQPTPDSNSAQSAQGRDHVQQWRNARPERPMDCAG